MRSVDEVHWRQFGLATVGTVARVAFWLSVSAAWLAFGIGDGQADTESYDTNGMGACLQATRIARGLTKAALARTVGLSPSAFAKIERGGQSGVDVVESLAQTLKVSPAWLAFGQGVEVLPARRRAHSPAQSPADAR